MSRIKYVYERTLPAYTANPPEKGEKKKKKKKKNPSINLGQRHLKYIKAGSAIECKTRIVTSQTDRQTNRRNYYIR
jgi:hypothetical protein